MIVIVAEYQRQLSLLYYINYEKFIWMHMFYRFIIYFFFTKTYNFSTKLVSKYE